MKRCIASFLPLVVTLLYALPLARGQVLPNGGFEDGTKGWGLSQQEMARAYFDAVDSDSSAGGKAGRIQVTVNGAPPDKFAGERHGHCENPWERDLILDSHHLTTVSRSSTGPCCRQLAQKRAECRDR